MKFPPSISPRWNIICNKSKAQMEVAFLWLVIKKAMRGKQMVLKDLGED